MAQETKTTQKPKKTADQKLTDAFNNIVRLAEQKAREEGKSDLVKAVTRAVDRAAKKVKDGKSKISFGDVVKTVSNKIISNPKPTTADVDACITALVEYRPHASEPEPRQKKGS